MSENVLIYFNSGSSFSIILTSGVSSDEITGCLSNIMPSGKESSIDFISWLFIPVEKRYSVTNKEAMSIYWCTKKSFQHLWGNYFTIRSNYTPLLGILGDNMEIPTMASAHLQRWSIFLLSFNYTLEFIKGQDHHTADLLSRLFLPIKFLSLDYEEKWSFISFLQFEYFPIDKSCIKTETDRSLSKVYDYLTHVAARNIYWFKIVQKGKKWTVEHA